MAVNSLTRLAFASFIFACAISAPIAAVAQSGIASTYLDGMTASGEHMKATAMTAAHRTLPFGTLVRVTSQRNGRSIVVRINDRGPFVAGRIIDLSPAAADALGLDGIAPVTVDVVGKS